MLTLEPPDPSLLEESRDLDEDEWRSWKRFGQSAALIYRQINAALTAQYDLSVPDVQLLRLLDTDSGHGIRMGVLADALVLAPSRMTWQVRRLEQRGLVRRFRSGDDGRGISVGITRRGRNYLRPVLHTYSVLVRQFYLAPLNREEMGALGNSAGRVSEALKNDGTATH